MDRLGRINKNIKKREILGSPQQIYGEVECPLNPLGDKLSLTKAYPMLEINQRQNTNYSIKSYHKESNKFSITSLQLTGRPIIEFPKNKELNQEQKQSIMSLLPKYSNLFTRRHLLIKNENKKNKVNKNNNNQSIDSLQEYQFLGTEDELKTYIQYADAIVNKINNVIRGVEPTTKNKKIKEIQFLNNDMNTDRNKNINNKYGNKYNDLSNGRNILFQTLIKKLHYINSVYDAILKLYNKEKVECSSIHGKVFENIKTTFTLADPSIDLTKQFQSVIKSMSEYIEYCHNYNRTKQKPEKLDKLLKYHNDAVTNITNLIMKSHNDIFHSEHNIHLNNSNSNNINNKTVFTNSVNNLRVGVVNLSKTIKSITTQVNSMKNEFKDINDTSVIHKNEHSDQKDNNPENDINNNSTEQVKEVHDLKGNNMSVIREGKESDEESDKDINNTSVIHKNEHSDQKDTNPENDINNNSTEQVNSMKKEINNKTKESYKENALPNEDLYSTIQRVNDLIVKVWNKTNVDVPKITINENIKDEKIRQFNVIINYYVLDSLCNGHHEYVPSYIEQINKLKFDTFRLSENGKNGVLICLGGQYSFEEPLDTKFERISSNENDDKIFYSELGDTILIDKAERLINGDNKSVEEDHDTSKRQKDINYSNNNMDAGNQDNKVKKILEKILEQHEFLKKNLSGYNILEPHFTKERIEDIISNQSLDELSLELNPIYGYLKKISNNPSRQSVVRYNYSVLLMKFFLDNAHNINKNNNSSIVSLMDKVAEAISYKMIFFNKESKDIKFVNADAFNKIFSEAKGMDDNLRIIYDTCCNFIERHKLFEQNLEKTLYEIYKTDQKEEYNEKMDEFVSASENDKETIEEAIEKYNNTINNKNNMNSNFSTVSKKNTNVYESVNADYIDRIEGTINTANDLIQQCWVKMGLQNQEVPTIKIDKMKDALKENPNLTTEQFNTWFNVYLLDLLSSIQYNHTSDNDIVFRDRITNIVKQCNTLDDIKVDNIVIGTGKDGGKYVGYLGIKYPLQTGGGIYSTELADKIFIDEAKDWVDKYIKQQTQQKTQQKTGSNINSKQNVIESVTNSEEKINDENYKNSDSSTIIKKNFMVNSQEKEFVNENYIDSIKDTIETANGLIKECWVEMGLNKATIPTIKIEKMKDALNENSCLTIKQFNTWFNVYFLDVLSLVKDANEETVINLQDFIADNVNNCNTLNGIEVGNNMIKSGQLGGKCVQYLGTEYPLETDKDIYSTDLANKIFINEAKDWVDKNIKSKEKVENASEEQKSIDYSDINDNKEDKFVDEKNKKFTQDIKEDIEFVNKLIKDVFKANKDVFQASDLIQNNIEIPQIDVEGLVQLVKEDNDIHKLYLFMNTSVLSALQTAVNTANPSPFIANIKSVKQSYKGFNPGTIKEGDKKLEKRLDESLLKELQSFVDENNKLNRQNKIDLLKKHLAFIQELQNDSFAKNTVIAMYNDLNNKKKSSLINLFFPLDGEEEYLSLSSMNDELLKSNKLLNVHELLNYLSKLTNKTEDKVFKSLGAEGGYNHQYNYYTNKTDFKKDQKEDYEISHKKSLEYAWNKCLTREIIKKDIEEKKGEYLDAIIKLCGIVGGFVPNHTECLLSKKNSNLWNNIKKRIIQNNQGKDIEDLSREEYYREINKICNKAINTGKRDDFYKIFNIITGYNANNDIQNNVYILGEYKKEPYREYFVKGQLQDLAKKSEELSKISDGDFKKIEYLIENVGHYELDRSGNLKNKGLLHFSGLYQDYMKKTGQVQNTFLGQKPCGLTMNDYYHNVQKIMHSAQKKENSISQSREELNNAERKEESNSINNENHLSNSLYNMEKLKEFKKDFIQIQDTNKNLNRSFALKSKLTLSEAMDPTSQDKDNIVNSTNNEDIIDNSLYNSKRVEKSQKFIKRDITNNSNNLTTDNKTGKTSKNIVETKENPILNSIKRKNDLHNKLYNIEEVITKNKTKNTSKFFETKKESNSINNENIIDNNLDYSNNLTTDNKTGKTSNNTKIKTKTNPAPNSIKRKDNLNSKLYNLIKLITEKKTKNTPNFSKIETNFISNSTTNNKGSGNNLNDLKNVNTSKTLDKTKTNPALNLIKRKDIIDNSLYNITDSNNEQGEILNDESIYLEFLSEGKKLGKQKEHYTTKHIYKSDEESISDISNFLTDHLDEDAVKKTKNDAFKVATKYIKGENSENNNSLINAFNDYIPNTSQLSNIIEDFVSVHSKKSDTSLGSKDSKISYDIHVKTIK